MGAHHGIFLRGNSPCRNPAHNPSDDADKARFVASIYDLIGKERSQASVARVLHLIEITSRAGRVRDGIDRVMHKARLDEGEE